MHIQRCDIQFLTKQELWDCFHILGSPSLVLDQKLVVIDHGIVFLLNVVFALFLHFLGFKPCLILSSFFLPSCLLVFVFSIYHCSLSSTCAPSCLLFSSWIFQYCCNCQCFTSRLNQQIAHQFLSFTDGKICSRT